MKHEIANSIATSMTAQKTTAAAYASSVTTVLIGGFTANEFAALIGACCTIVLTVATIYYKHRELKAKENGKH